MKKSLFIFVIFFSTLLSVNLFSQITSKKSGNWNSTSTWNGGSIPTSNDQVTISDGHTVTINTNASCRNLTIGTGGLSAATLNFDGSARTLTVSGFITGYVYISGNGVLNSTSGVGQTIYIAGDFFNYGTFTQGTNNTVNFNGTSQRGIYGNNIAFYNLVINNSGGILLDNNASVNGTLTLTSGLFYITNDTLTVNGDISVISPSATKMIVLDDGTNFGRLKLATTSNKSYLFPVGDTRSTDEYSPATINLTSGANASAYISVNLKNQKDANNTSSNNYLNRAWFFNQTGLTSFNYNINLTYLNSDVVGTESLMYFGKYDNGIWTLLGQPNTSTNIFAYASLASFSTFTGGDMGSLPVRLQSLSGAVSGRNANISWVTNSETNNSGFEVQRASIDQNGTAGNYQSIGFVKGSGTTTELKSYTFTDKNLNTGKYKYILKQTDYNGNSEYFELENIIEIGIPNKINLSQNFPNPFNPVTKINFEIPADSKLTLAVYDITGKEITKLVNNVFKSAGFHSVDFNGSNLSSGVYFYKLTTDNFTSVKRMTLIK